MKKVSILVLDSFSIGASADAERFGDAGSDTLGHIARACASGEADNGRQGNLFLPNLTALGLTEAAKISTDAYPQGMTCAEDPVGAWACAGVRQGYQYRFSGQARQFC